MSDAQATTDALSRVMDQAIKQSNLRSTMAGPSVESITLTELAIIVANETPRGKAPFEFLFDEANPNWKSVPEYNIMYLRQIELYYNRKLGIRGFVFLHEILEEIGFSIRLDDTLCGWTKGDTIDLCLFDSSGNPTFDFTSGPVLIQLSPNSIKYSRVS